MAKVSKNSRVNRGKSGGGKNYVKVIVAVKSPTTGAYTYKETIVHKDNVKQTISEAN